MIHSKWATLAVIRAGMVPSFTDRAPSEQKMSQWFESAGILHRMENGETVYDVASVEVFLRQVNLQGGLQGTYRGLPR